MKALKADNVPEDAEGVVTWFYRVLRHAIIDAHRRKTTRDQALEKLVHELPEALEPEDEKTLCQCVMKLLPALPEADAVLVGDYGKGAVSQPLLEALRRECRPRGIWLSVDPKPVNPLDLSGLSLLTPNRKEAFELAGGEDDVHAENPLADRALLGAAERLLDRYQPALLLVTLGSQGMLLCRREHPPVHIPTVAREVFDVSGAGDTVIAAFTLAIACGASPLEAAIVSNHAAGVVVAKVGTATVSRSELLESFAADR